MRRKVTKAEIHEYLSRRSREMAESGDYGDYMSIELALKAEGFPEARGFLDSRLLRWELNRLCNQARAKRGLPLSPVAKDANDPFVG
jgi:hypothetical protein